MQFTPIQSVAIISDNAICTYTTMLLEDLHLCSLHANHPAKIVAGQLASNLKYSSPDHSAMSDEVIKIENSSQRYSKIGKKLPNTGNPGKVPSPMMKCAAYARSFVYILHTLRRFWQ